MFKELLRRSLGSPSPEAATPEAASSVVLSVPPVYARDFERRMGGLTLTYEAVSDLFASAQRTVHIFSPYVDPTITGLIQRTRTAVRIVTTARDCRGLKPSPVLERCAGLADLQTRYVVEHQNKAQIFQMHAKMVLVDGAAAYVGSANLTDTSLHYNLELGILTKDAKIVTALEEVFDHVWNHLSVTARAL